jgi:hypothetical protein
MVSIAYGLQTFAGRVATTHKRRNIMGNWKMNIEGIGPHHNPDCQYDADVMLQVFTEQLKEAGHSVSNISFLTGISAALPAIGSPLAGGFFAGEMTLAGERFALIVAPKSEGEKAGDDGLQYKIRNRDTADDSDCDDDGVANTDKINDDNHPAVQFCRSLTIGGFNDWYLPSRDELMQLWRNLGPNRKNTPELFKAEAAEAFEEEWYWSSTEHAQHSGYVWVVGFTNGNQGNDGKDYGYGVRAVRRFKI